MASDNYDKLNSEMPSRKFRVYFYQLDLNEKYYALPIIKGLQENGCEVFWNEFKIYSKKEHIETVKSFKPDFIVMYGFTFVNYLAFSGENLFAEELKIPYVTIFDDNPLRYLFFLKDYNTKYHITMCCDSGLVQQLRDEGFQNVYWLPLFYDPEVDYPRKKMPELSHDLVFPGSVTDISDVRKGQQFGWTPNMVKIQNHLYDMREKTPGKFVNYFSEGKKFLPLPDISDPMSMNFSFVMSQNVLEQKYQARMELFDALEQYPIHIYGVGTWKPERKNIFHHDYLDQHTQIPFLYSSAKIILCLEMLPNCVHQRVYEVMACKGFIISEYREDMYSLFEPDKEIVVFNDFDDLRAKVDRYLSDEAARQKIVEAAYKKVTANYTVKHLMKKLLKIVKPHL